MPDLVGASFYHRCARMVLTQFVIFRYWASCLHFYLQFLLRVSAIIILLNLSSNRERYRNCSIASLVGSLNLFKAALRAVLRSPTAFFDTTPMGTLYSTYM